MAALLAGAPNLFCAPADVPDPVPDTTTNQSVAKYQPLTPAERWRRYWKDTLLTPGLWAAAAATSLSPAISKDPPEWGGGAAGWTRRSASYVGTVALQESIHQGGSAALGYDPRYLKCDCKGFFQRAGHAVLWTFLTKDNSGDTRLDVPSLAGAYGSGMLSMLWFPKRYDPLTDGVRTGTQQVGFSLGMSVVHEFGDELKRTFLHKKSQ